MANKYNIIITAQDAATARIRAIKRSISELIRPITDTGKSAAALGKETGIDKIGASLAGAGKNAIKMLSSVKGIGGGLAGAIGVGSLSAIGIWSKNWADANRNVSLASATIGVATQKIQALEGVGKLSGLQPGAMTAGLDALGTTLNDAKWGQNQEALLLMNRMGLQFKTLKNGAIDSVGALEDIADVIAKMNAPIQTKALVARTFGLEQLLPVLLKGKQGIRDLVAESEKLRKPLSNEQQQQAVAYAKSIDALGLSFEHLGDSIMFTAMPALAAIGNWISRHNDQAAKNIAENGFFGALARGTAKYNLDLFKFVGRAVTFDWGARTPENTLGRLIGKGEGGVNSVNLGRAGGYKSAQRPLAQMTVRQVMDAQAAGEFNAAGKYQLIKGTLRDGVAALGIDPDKTKFDAKTQDRLFRDFLLKMKRPEIGAYVSGQSNDLHAALKGAAKEWASLADPDTGKSAYDGLAGNKASIPAIDVAKALMQARGEEPWTRAEVRATAPAGSFNENPSPGPGATAAGAGAFPASQARGPSLLALPGSKPAQTASLAPSAAPGGDRAADGANAPLVLPGGQQAAQEAPAGPSAAALADLWAKAPKEGHTVVRLEIPNAPAGTKAEVVSSKGPVRTELKVEHSMPDYSL